MKYILLGLIIPSILLAGCATCDTKKLDQLESRMTAVEAKCGIAAESQTAAPAASETTINTETATPQIQVPETPSKKDIQAALKNAGFYQGDLDGKFGPKTKKAVEDFQATNQLKVDGKVGPNTWEKLKNYYTPTEESEASQPKMD